MKAVRFHEFGGPEVLQVDEVDRPEPGAGEVRIRTAGSTFNLVDDGIRGGYLQGPFPVTLPHVPGVEIAGTVDAVGPGVQGLEVGQEVVGFLPMVADGSAAEYAIAPAEVLTRAPAGVPLADAAALPMVGLTAWQALFEQAGLTSGQRLLVHGAGGAVGGYAVQLAHGAGAHLIAVGSPRSSDRLRRLGADEVVDHTATEVTAAVTEPVDVLLNLASVPADELATLTRLVRDGGIVVNTVPGTPSPGDESRGVRAAGVFVRSDAEQLARLVGMVERGELEIGVDRRVTLDDLASVHAEADAGTLRGKVVVTPA
ncbi:NADP-dependent oxidoreductase [Actinomycetospora sp. OC33-EN08]|uniref:NADP-dependent oxidoreductase n=1 Tax=Actinomycetospora aurantiaca TaxID=3129233 RepID=A0ABU8MV89_9PSEU